MPKTRARFIGIALVTVLVVLFSAVHPLVAHADEVTPPPDNPADVSAGPAPSDAADPAVAADSASASDPELASHPVDAPASVPEILSQAPEDTVIVALDDNGNAVALATEQAADIISTGDPQWCPGSALPGDPSCTPARSSFNGAGGLLAYLRANAATYTGAGTIYVADSYSSAGEGGSVVLNGNAGYGLTDVTIQGGWDFGSNTRTGTSSFEVPLTVKNWTHDVTLNDLIFQAGETTTSLTVATSGNIELNDVTVRNNGTGDGARLNNSSAEGAATVTVNDSKFRDNSGTGLQIISNGDVSLNSVIANANGTGISVNTVGTIALDDVTARNNTSGMGARLNNTSSVDGADVSVTSSEFSGNSDTGLHIASTGDVSLDAVTANNNGNGGLTVNTSGSITLNDVTARTNDSGNGATLNNTSPSSASSVTVQGNSDFSRNSNNGLHIVSNGDVTVSDGTFTKNDANGLYVETYGNITVSDVVAYGNQKDGADLDNSGNTSPAGASIQVSDSYFGSYDPDAGIDQGNRDNGVEASSAGDVSLSNVTAGNNRLNGAAIYAPSVSVSDSTFNWNHRDGLLIQPGVTSGDVSLSGVTASNNDGSGAEIDPSTLSVSGSTFDSNQEGGLVAQVDGNIVVNCSDFASNGGFGLSAQGNSLMTNGDTFSMNTLGDVDWAGPGSWSDNADSVECPTGDKDDQGDQTGQGSPAALTLPWNTIHVTGGQDNTLDCAQFAGTTLMLPNGDRVLLPCPTGDRASLVSLTTDQLPGPLEGQLSLVSGVKVQVSPDVTGSITVGFTIPAGQQASSFAILHWDGAKWVDVGGTQVGNLFVVDSALTGDFILVSK